MQLLIAKTLTAYIHAEGKIKTKPNKPKLVPCYDMESDILQSYYLSRCPELVLNLIQDVLCGNK